MPPPPPPSLPKGTPGKSRQVRVWLSMPAVVISHATLGEYLDVKIKEFDTLLPEILMIKESCNLTG